jgi:cytochrome c
LYDVPKIPALFRLTIIVMIFCIPDAYAEGNAANGATIFKQCGACHSAEKGENIFGPSLYGVIGRPAGSVADFSYSLAMQEAAAKGLVWTPENITAYLLNPRKFLHDFSGDHEARNNMTFSLADPKERDDVVAFLKSQAVN